MMIGDKIRNIRTLKGFSQENMAEMLDLSLLAYGDIERNKKDISLNRLEGIAKVLGVSATDILSFGDSVSNFFTQCENAIGVNNGNQNHYYDAQEVRHSLEKLSLEIEKLKAEKEKAELEAKYWREKQNISV